jgi:hypothetical protein
LIAGFFSYPAGVVDRGEVILGVVALGVLGFGVLFLLILLKKRSAAMSI